MKNNDEFMGNENSFEGNENNSEGKDIPLGLGMAFAQNVDAMQYFSSLSKAQQQSVIDKAHGIGSKEEMQTFVAELGEKNLS